MKKQNILIGIGILLVVIVLAVILLPKKNKFPDPVPTTKVTTTTPSVTGLEAQKTEPQSSPTPEKSTVPNIIRTKIRNDFIVSCKSAYQGQYAKSCPCIADYLGTHYTDKQLTDMYVQFHKTNELSSEIETAANACK